jgi:hypothetical protein
MTSHSDGPRIESGRYRAAIEMAGFAEKNGFAVVSVEEHHVAENGWLPSPLTLAAAIIGRTETIAVNCTALLITLYDPIRLAEDIAVRSRCRDRLERAGGQGFALVSMPAPEEAEHVAGRGVANRVASTRSVVMQRMPGLWGRPAGFATSWVPF